MGKKGSPELTEAENETYNAARERGQYTGSARQFHANRYGTGVKSFPATVARSAKNKISDLLDSADSYLSGKMGNTIRSKQVAGFLKGLEDTGYKKGGKVKAKGGAVKSSASKRADGCAVRGKTKGRMV